MGILFVGSLFLTLEYSKPIWDLFRPIMALFQFPWRFLVFGMFGAGFFSAYVFSLSKHPVRYIVIAGLILVLFITGKKYFIKPLMDHEVYNGRYNSLDYRQRILPYNMREYLPVGVKYDYWHYLNPTEVNAIQVGFDYNKPVQFEGDFTVIQNTPFEKEVVVKSNGTLIVNVHNFPFWHISVNNNLIKVLGTDNLARPKIEVESGDTIQIKYRQTSLEKLANALTLFGTVLLFFPERILALVRPVYQHASSNKHKRKQR